MATPTLEYFVDNTGVTWSIQVNPDGSLTTTVVSTSTTIPPVGFYNTQAGDIVNAVIQDAQVLTTNRTAMLDYVNRVHQRILRESQWQFLLSENQRFITQPGATKYWIGNGNPPAGAVQTGLQLNNVWAVPNDHVFDGTNWRKLQPDSKTVLTSPAYSYQDTTPRYDVPRSFLYEITNPGVLSIFPAPDNQNIYQPVPLPPICVAVSGGSLPGRTYYVKASFVDSQGNEGTTSTQPTVIYVPANFLLSAAQPTPEVSSAAMVNYNQWNIYVGTSPTNLTKQNASALTTTFTEPTSGLVNGASIPRTSNLEPLFGYVIEFRYYQQRLIIQGLADILQIPDMYKDVVIAGVNWFCSMYTSNDGREINQARAAAWKAEFMDGIRQIRKDLNINFRKTDYVSPDSASQYAYGNVLDWPIVGTL